MDLQFIASPTRRPGQGRGGPGYAENPPATGASLGASGVVSIVRFQEQRDKESDS